MRYAVPHWSRSVLQAQPHPCSVIEAADRKLKQGQAPFELSRQIRERVQDDTGIETGGCVGYQGASDRIVRHNSKIDRPALGEWASKVLAGA